MRYGIFSDIHSNLEALTVVINFFKSNRIDRYLCAGDAVGYGPDPNECVELLRKLAPLRIVVGNHDWAACGLKSVTWFNEYAKKAIMWTKNVLSEENQIYLSELPKIVYYSGFTLVHGSPRDPLDEYLLTRQQYQDNLPYLTANITCVGHSHVPFIFGMTSTHFFKDPCPVTLSPDDRYVINTGSVGQPRDSDNRASCGIFDTETREFRLHRLEYDISKTQEKMRRARLPAFLTERLSWGK